MKFSDLTLTADPHIRIEEQREGYVRYQSDDGRRWEVHGTCIRLGNCLIGAVIDGFGMIESHEDIERAKKKLGRERIDSEMDVPVGPGFKDCCPLRVVEL
jgi:hypothetical protein